jgi:hypothetical protein
MTDPPDVLNESILSVDASLADRGKDVERRRIAGLADPGPYTDSAL